MRRSRPPRKGERRAGSPDLMRADVSPFGDMNMPEDEIQKPKKNYGEDATNEFYEAVANSSETLSEGDINTASQKDLRTLISAQFDLIEELNKKG